jgi:hypothetical protein
MRVRLAPFGVTVCLCFASIVVAQDAVKTDPKHYSVISENDQVRILKVHYGPHEKSIMHSHPNLVAVFLTDSHGQFLFADGKKVDFTAKAGDAQYLAANTHLPESRNGFDPRRVERPRQALEARAISGAGPSALVSSPGELS